MTKIVIFQIQCLKSLLSNEVIINKLNDELIISRQIYDEFMHEDNDLIIKLDSFVDKRIIKIQDMIILTDEYYTYRDMLKGKHGKIYSRCESSSLSIAIHSNASLLTEKHEKQETNIGKHTLTWITLSDYLKSIN